MEHCRSSTNRLLVGMRYVHRMHSYIFNRMRDVLTGTGRQFQSGRSVFQNLALISNCCRISIWVRSNNLQQKILPQQTLFGMISHQYGKSPFGTNLEK